MSHTGRVHQRVSGPETVWTLGRQESQLFEEVDFNLFVLNRLCADLLDGASYAWEHPSSGELPVSSKQCLAFSISLSFRHVDLIYWRTDLQLKQTAQVHRVSYVPPRIWRPLFLASPKLMCK